MGMLSFLDPASWTFWVAIGIILAILEIMDGSFFLLSLGLGCLAPALAAGLGVSSVTALVAICAAAQIGVFLAVRPVFQRMTASEGQPTNAAALAGRQGVVVTDICGSITPGYVKVGGEEWRAICGEGLNLTIGQRVVVRELAGATLTVAPIGQESGES